jgi:hypothetical protein
MKEDKKIVSIDKNRGGRPSKYLPEYAKQARKLCLLDIGITDAHLAEFFEVNEDTIYEWKKKFPEFSESVKGGKKLADANVAAALYKRAIGFTYDEVTFEKIDAKVVLETTTAGDIKTDQAYKKKVVTKLVVPDTGAAMNWLKNRQKELWRDNEIDYSKMTDEQLDYIIEKLKKRA